MEKGYNLNGWHVYIDANNDGTETQVKENGEALLLTAEQLKDYVLPVGKKSIFKAIFTPYTYLLNYAHAELYLHDGSSSGAEATNFKFKETETFANQSIDYGEHPTDGPTSVIINNASLYSFLNWSYEYVDANGIARSGIIEETDASVKTCQQVTESEACTVVLKDYKNFVMYGRPEADKDTPIMMTANYAKKPFAAAQTKANGHVDVALTEEGLEAASTKLFDSVDLDKPLSADNKDDAFIKYYPDKWFYLSSIQADDLYGNTCTVNLKFNADNGEAVPTGTVNTCGIGQTQNKDTIQIDVNAAGNTIHVSDFETDASSAVFTLTFSEYPKHNVNFFALDTDNKTEDADDVYFGQNKDIHETDKIGTAISEKPTREGYTFVGWAEAYEVLGSKDTQTAAAYSSDTVMGDKDQDYYAVWRKNVYAVTFYDYDGNEIDANGDDAGNTQMVDYMDDATSPDKLPTPVTIPTKEGYTFAGWDKSLNDITHDLDVYAVYTRNFYTVAFYDHDMKVISTETYGHGDILQYPTVTHDDYTFEGWYSNEALTSAFPIVEDYIVESNLNIYAKCTKNEEDTFTVEFVDDEGNLLKNEDVVKHGNATAPADPVKEGYTFVGWDKPYTDVTEDTTVTAVFKKNDSTDLVVRFFDHDQTLMKTQVVAMGAAASAPAAPTHNAFKFLGWNKAFNHITENTDVTAQCAPVTFTVNYFGKSNEVLKTEIVDYGQDGNPPAVTAPEGTVFTGWDKDYHNITEDTDLYGQFATQKFSVVYKVEEALGSEIIKIDEVEYNEASSVPTPPEKTGYVFAGWKFITVGNNNLEHVTQNITVEAKYVEKAAEGKINVIYLDHDGSLTASTVKNKPSIIAIADVPVLTDPHGDSFTFKYWSLNGEEVEFPYTIANTQSDPLVFKAVCELVSHEVLFVSDDYVAGGTGTILSSQTVKHHGSAEAPEPPTKDGYTFVGWDTAFDDVTGDLIVKPIYTQDTYTAIFYNDDGSVFAFDQGHYGELIEGPTADPVSGLSDANHFLYFKGTGGKMYADTAVYTGNMSYTAVYKQYGSITTDGDRIGGNDFSHYIDDGELSINDIINKGGIEAFDKDGNPIPADKLTFDQTQLKTIQDAIKNGTTGEYALTITTPDGTSITIIITLKKRPVTERGPWVVTFLDCSGNTISVQSVEDGKDASAPKGYAYSGYWNVTAHKDIYPNTCTAFRFPVVITGDKS